MVNKLKSCSLQSHIADLPDVINSNNESVISEFDNIFDSTLNMLNKSIYAPVGYVSSYLADFDELQTEYITVENKDSFKASITSCTIDEIGKLLKKHEELEDCWSSVDASNQFGIYSDLAHDSSTIIYESNSGDVTLYQKLTDILDGSLSSNVLHDIDAGIDVSISDIDDIFKWRSALETKSVTIIDNGQQITYKLICEKPIS